MKILLFSDNSQVAQKIARLPPAEQPQILSTSAAAKTVRLGYSGLVYLDLYRLVPETYQRLLTTLVKSTTAHTGIIDSAGVVGDPAELFHRGAVDFISKGQWSEGMTRARVARVAKFIQAFRTAPDAESGEKIVHKSQIMSGSDWSTVEQGQEYTFYVMFVELDDKQEMEKKYGLRSLGSSLLSFKAYVEDFSPTLAARSGSGRSLAASSSFLLTVKLPKRFPADFASCSSSTSTISRSRRSRI